MKELSKVLLEKLKIDKNTKIKDNKIFDDYDHWADYLEYNDAKIVNVTNRVYAICITESENHIPDCGIEGLTYPYFYFKEERYEDKDCWNIVDKFGGENKIAFNTNKNSYQIIDKKEDALFIPKKNFDTVKDTYDTYFEYSTNNADLILETLGKLYYETIK